MQHLSFKLEKYRLPQLEKINGPRSERDEQIGGFLNRGIKVGRVAHLRDVTAQDLGVLLSHIPTADLYAFRRQCEKARSFSRYFWWALKPKPMTEGAGVRG